jgi:hypothetical protein
MLAKCCVDVETCCPSTKALNVEYLYLDLQSCDRCQSTDKRLEKALTLLRPILHELGYHANLSKIHMSTQALAIQHRFLSSPTIRINGCDLFETITENNCGCCSEISGHDTDCRTFMEDGESVNAPSVKLLIERILRHVLNGHQAESNQAYVLPENLKQFYQKKP